MGVCCVRCDKGIRPDLAFVDSNCDGIDGREANAVFASPLGKDTNPGTKAAPKRQIDAAVFAANGNGRYVLAADGLYTGVVAVTGVGIYGGYDARTWGRTASQATRIVGSPEGLRADDATGVVVQLLTVLGSPGAGAPSSYGIRAINGSSLTLQRVSVFATRAGAGAPGANGVAGQNGKNGEFGHLGTSPNSLGDCVSNRFPSGGGSGYQRRRQERRRRRRRRPRGRPTTAGPGKRDASARRAGRAATAEARGSRARTERTARAPALRGLAVTAAPPQRPVRQQSGPA